MANEAPKIGLDNVVIAPVLSDGPDGISYGNVISLKGAVNASVNPNSDVAVDFADNGPFFAASNRGNTEMSLELIDVDTDVLAQMLGQKKENGITVETPLDQSPDFAMGFRVWLAGKDDNGNNRYQYFWYAKGKFSVPETGGETKTDSLSFGHVNMTAQFVQTQYVPEGYDTGVICTHLRTDDPTVDSTVKANWFNAPVIETSVDATALTVSATASEGVVTITATKASGATAKIAPASVKLGGSVLVFDSTGASVNASAVVSGAIITVTPAQNAEAIASVIVTDGVKDAYGVAATPYSNSSL